MELLYLWIEKYRNIKRQGFNFSSEYRFDYTWEGDDWKNGKLVGEKNENVIPNFFNALNQETTDKTLATISNITAIVGENGSGKSSLLDFLVENLGGSYNIHEDCKNVFLSWTHESHSVHEKNAPSYEGIKSNFNLAAFFVCKINDGLDLQALNKVDKIFDENKLSSGKRLPNNNSIVYYSNVFDGKITKASSSTRLINISTNYLLRNAKYNAENKSLEQVTAFKSEETRKRLKFLTANEGVKFTRLPFQLPKKMALVISNESGILKFNQELKDMLLQNRAYYKMLDRTTPHLDSFIKETKENKQKLFLWSLLFNILINQPVDVPSYFNELNENIKPYLSTTSISKKTITDICRSIQFNDKITDLEDYIDFYLKAIAEDSKNINMRGGTHLDTIYLDYSKENIVNLETVLSSYISFLASNLKKTNQGYSIVPFIYVDWTRTLSTGESLYLNLFSRLYKFKELDIEKIILLFDEIETGYHPQWQKEFLKTLVEYLPKIFPSETNEEGKLVQRSIQIILTSHSPFVVSDLPKDNVIFLRKGKVGETIDGIDMEGKCMVDKEQQKNNFTKLLYFSVKNTMAQFTKYDSETESKMQTYFQGLTQKDKRHYSAVEAMKLGWGGKTYISKLLGISQFCIRRGEQELSDEQLLAEIPAGKQRRPGGGRKKKN